jgi:hypothetical protein
LFCGRPSHAPQKTGDTAALCRIRQTRLEKGERQTAISVAVIILNTLQTSIAMAMENHHSFIIKSAINEPSITWTF